MENPNFFAILTADVRYSENINANEKLLYAEITALSNSTGVCWASNNYFAKLYKCTPQAVSKWIKNLKSNGFISIRYYYKSGTKEIDKREITCINIGLGGINTRIACINHDLEGYQPPIKDNNTSINNKNNNSFVETKVSPKKDEERKEVQESLFPDELISTEKEIPKKVAQKKVKNEVDPDKQVKRLFRNSDVYKMVNFETQDYSEFESRFNTPEFDPVDLVYYFHVVSDWSDTKNEKRTKNGWIATVRTFIRGDAEKNKVKLKIEYQPEKIDENKEMLELLNRKYGTST